MYIRRDVLSSRQSITSSKVDAGCMERMRSSIIGCTCYHLQEQAGMFCDALEGHGVDWSGAEYLFCEDEPYELHFEWYLDGVKWGLTVYADRDDTEWSVVSDDGRSRFRKRVDWSDVEGSARGFAEEVRGAGFNDC